MSMPEPQRRENWHLNEWIAFENIPYVHKSTVETEQKRVFIHSCEIFF